MNYEGNARSRRGNCTLQDKRDDTANNSSVCSLLLAMTDITVSDELAERIEGRIQCTDFENVDDYAEFVLSEVVTRVEREGEETPDSTASGDEVENRLQSLGYLEE